MTDKGIFAVAVLSLAIGLVSTAPNQRCLDCMCQASSGCKTNIRCHNTNGQYFCGPYQISWAYWADGGKQGSAGFANDFETCLVDKACAEATIQGYMAKWGNDCNGDGRVDCLDYAAIHKAGPKGCQQSWLLNSKYWAQFNQCYRGSGGSGLSGSVFASAGLYTPRGNSRPVGSLRSVTSPLGTIIEIPKPSIRTINLALTPEGDFSPAVASGSSSSSSSRTVTYPTNTEEGGVVIHSSYSASSSSRSNYSRTEETSISSGSSLIGGREEGPPDGVADAAFVRPARVQGTSNKPTFTISSAPVTSYRPRPASRVVEVTEEIVSHQAPPPTTRYTSVTTYNAPASSSAISHSPPRAHRPVLVEPAVVEVPRPAAVATAAPVAVTNFNQIVASDCIECLCHASSKCNLAKGCDGAYCGPFLLSWGYWADGGQPGGGRDYPTCARDRACAQQAVQGYMNKWQRDCNGDGKVDCIDFALIHKLGPHACGKLAALESTDYWKQFTECRADLGGNTGGGESDVTLVEVANEERNPSERSISPSSPSPVNSLAERFAGALNDRRPSSDDLSGRVAFTNREVRPAATSSARYSQPSETPPSSNINSNLISRSPYLNRPVAVPVAPVARPSLPEVYEEMRNSLPTVRNIDENLANNERPSNRAPLVVEELPRAQTRPAPRPLLIKPPPPQELGLTEVVAPVRIQSNLARSQATNITNGEAVAKECLECICHASSRCSLSLGCINGGRGKFNCGPYQVDWEYWSEAGKPGNRADLSNMENFQMCLNNRECADQTVRAYLARFGKDCNDDGVIDCNDFAALHVAGPRACNAQWYTDSKYYSDFRECYDF